MKELVKKSATIIMVMVILMTMLVVGNVQQVSAASGVKSIKVTNFKKKTLTLNKGKKKTLKVKVTTTGKKVSKAFTVKSNNAKVVKAVKSGNNVKLTAKKNGKASITIKSKANQKKKLVLTVTVKTPVKQVKLNQTSTTLMEGNSITLSATVTPTDASNKNVTWSTSNSAVATVSNTGVVNAIKAGTATITAKATDGSNKSASCKVVVNALPNSIVSAKVYLGNVIRVDLAKAQELTKSNFSVMTKSADVSTYMTNLDIYDLSTLDNKTYTIMFKSDRIFTIQDDIKITITGLEGTSTAATHIIAGAANNRKSQDYETCVTKYSETNIASVYVYSNVSGCYTYTYDQLPKGATIEKRGSSLYIRYKCNYYENMVSTFKFKDDQGNESTSKVYFGVYDNTHIHTYARDITSVESGIYKLDRSVNKIGGSGSYKYELISAPASVRINSYGEVYGYLFPGEYKITYKVIDANDASISGTSSFNVIIKDGKTLSGRITDANGRDINECSIYAVKNDSMGDVPDAYVSPYYYGEAGYYSMVLEPGTYTIVASCENCSVFMYDVKITEDVEGFNISFPVYAVLVDVQGYNLVDDWTDKDGIEYGYNYLFYLKKGRYELTNKATNSAGEEVDLKLNINVTGDMTVKPVVVAK